MLSMSSIMAAVHELASRGGSVSSIAKHLKVSPAKVRHYWPHDMESYASRRKRLKVEKVREYAPDLRDNGFSYRKIADMLDVPVSLVHKHLADHVFQPSEDLVAVIRMSKDEHETPSAFAKRLGISRELAIKAIEHAEKEGQEG